METGARGSNGQYVRKLVETAQSPEHVTVITLLHSMAVNPVRDRRMIQHSASRDIVRVCLSELFILVINMEISLKRHGLQTFYKFHILYYTSLNSRLHKDDQLA